MQGEQDYVWVTNNFAKKAFPQKGLFVSAIRFTLVPTADDKAVEQQLRSYFLRHLPDTDDKQSLGLFNLAAHAHKFHAFFKNLTMGSWIIGVCFLITGIVGITNMMLVMVQDRRQELSIRRILGASSREIVAMILWEALIVTFLAGLLGLLGGYTLLYLLNKYVVALLKNYYMTPLSCSFKFILRGLGFILLSSGAAVVYPVIRALKIRPIEALNDSL
ncbi:MAG: ABC transporter permease [Amoebophilaceae bacterium]|nr:ABC transporter permease [Amoebophilaceae bacterium]